MNPKFLLVLIFLFIAFSYNGFDLQTFMLNLTYGLPAILVGFSLHEFAHAFVADRLGDPTPRQEGRITLDIRKHIDVIGILLVIFFQFGWAKPVMINTRNLKNTKRDMALIAAAGPIMNVLISLISVVVLAKVPMNDTFQALMYQMFIINAGLAVFNMIPVPPLDGSRVIGAFMTNKFYYKFVEFEYKFADFLLMFLLLFAWNFLSAPLTYLVKKIWALGLLIANLLPF